MKRVGRVLAVLILVGLAAASCAAADVLLVGPLQSLTTPSAAARVARDGDTIKIDAGLYERDAAVWTQNDLTISGPAFGGRAHLKARGASVEGKGIWVIKGRNTTVENIEFSEARVKDRNGAGIRQEGAGVTIRNCYFHDNEDGILAGSTSGDVVIENSEFAYNGTRDGQAHNIYIGRTASFTLRASYSHHAQVGHLVKSRALTNNILYNRIMDEATGTASYAIDLPNGGVSYVIGNLIQQGPKNQNRTVVSYGAEGLVNPSNALYMVNNTLVNDDPTGGVFLFISAQADPAAVRLINNFFVGPGTLVSGPGQLPESNLRTDQPGFVSRAAYDYRLLAGSPAIDRGTDPGTANGILLAPDAEYVHPLNETPRAVMGQRIDVGAYEFQP